MGKWLRVDACFRDHPKFIRAGFWGAVAAQAAWEVAKKFDLADGDVTSYWDPALLADHLRLRDHLDELEDGMAAAVKHGLVDKVDGRLVVHDWADYQRDISTERTRMWRNRRMGTVGNDDETKRNGAERRRVLTGRDGTGQDTTATRAHDPTGRTATSVAGTESHDVAESQCTGRPPAPVVPLASTTCPDCGGTWRLIRHREGDFYGHGSRGGKGGCTSTCPVDELGAYEPSTSTDPLDDLPPVVDGSRPDGPVPTCGPPPGGFPKMPWEAGS